MRLSFTGNRSTTKNKELMWRLHQTIEMYIEKGCVDFLCGGSIGADTFFALSVLKHKEKYKNIKLILYLPCREQDKLWNQQQKEQYKEILEKADEVVYISEHYTDSCMLLRNLKLIEDSTHLLSIFNGESKGGTYYTINKAKKLDTIKEIFIIKP